MSDADMTWEEFSKKKWTKAEYNRVIDEFVERQNKKIGEEEAVGYVPLRPGQRTIAHHIVTDDQIRLYASAVGDPNPLWHDPTYGRKTRWGSTIAPPVGEVIIAEYGGWPPYPRVPGWQQHPAGCDRVYNGVIRPMDEFKNVDKYHGIREIKHADWPDGENLKNHRLFMTDVSRKYINQRDEVVCVLTNHLRCVARFPGEEEPVPDKPIRRYTEEELDMVYRAYDEELEGKWRRGAEIRYWEDVNVGDEPHEIILGPMDITDASAFIGSIGGICVGYAMKWQMTKKARALFGIEASYDLRDPETGFVSTNRHSNDEVAQLIDRCPRWMSFGCHEEATIAHLITNWMGDDAFVKKLAYGRFYPKVRGDLSFIRGKVVKKYVENGEHLVDIDASEQDQDGLVQQTCMATVRLISRADQF